MTKQTVDGGAKPTSVSTTPTAAATKMRRETAFYTTTTLLSTPPPFAQSTTTTGDRGYCESFGYPPTLPAGIPAGAHEAKTCGCG